ITDPEKVRKFVCVDTNDAPEVAVVDPDMMASMPAGLTASTGMDALTHAIEGYTTKGAWELSDMFHFEAIKLISENLRDSVAEAKSGQPGSGREGMALGQYVAGMGFSNVGLGIDHAMAHTLSAHYDTPHGVACAMLLPIAMEFNKPVCAERLAKVAVAMGVDTTGMSTDEAADAAIAAVKQLSADVNIPHACEAMKADEIEVLAKDAMADACFPGNPREATLDDVIELFKKICPAA
ncbi:MAG: iron-containing alcohol dehydrogenase, partial [Collinsella sp.]|nr:iron-containing alcohol dehydrogenase [Collinsella sp.]